MNESRAKNQSGLINPEVLSKSEVLVIGAGAIGSFYTMTLAKMGCENITVIDDDKIEEHNISTQMFPIYMIDKHKVTALKDVCEAYGDVEITPVVGKYIGASSYSDDIDIYVVCVDNMDVRKMIWDSVKHRTSGLFLEGRMGAQVYRCYAVDMSKLDQKEFYEKNLYPQSQAIPDRCSQKSIIYTVLQVAGDMLSVTKKYLAKERFPNEIIRDCLLDTFSAKWLTKQVFEEIDGSDEEVMEPEVIPA